MSSTITQERRKLTRVGFQGRVEIDPVIPHLNGQRLALQAHSVNLSEGGLCVRLEHELAIRSRVILRLFTPPRKRPFECNGRIAWVVQRLDLRTTPPFLYDVGVEFLSPSVSLRQFAVRLGLPFKPIERAAQRLQLPAATIRDRQYTATLEQERARSQQWHMIVMVDGTPCFGQRCESLQDAKAAWLRFRRQRRAAG